MCTHMEAQKGAKFPGTEATGYLCDCVLGQDTCVLAQGTKSS